MDVIDGNKKVEGCTQLLKWVEMVNPRTKRMEPVPLYCQKVTEPGKALCPHHELLLKEESLERSRRAQKAALTKARKANALADLAMSPLQAVNTDYIQKEESKEKGTYSV